MRLDLVNKVFKKLHLCQIHISPELRAKIDQQKREKIEAERDEEEERRQAEEERRRASVVRQQEQQEGRRRGLSVLGGMSFLKRQRKSTSAITDLEHEANMIPIAAASGEYAVELTKMKKQVVHLPKGTGA